MWTASIHDYPDTLGGKFHILKGGLVADETLHNHDVWELSIITGGSSLHHVEDQCYSTQAGDIFTIIPPFSHLNITESYQRYQHKFVSHLLLTPPQLAFACQLCDQLCAAFAEKKAGRQVIVDVCFLHLLTWLSSLYTPPSPKKTELFYHMEKTVDYIEANYAAPIQVPMLAEIACLSERQYTRLFRQLYGTSPMQYVIQCRLAHARTLIQTTSLTISQVAEQCGFFDKSAFTKLYKKHYQTTPNAARLHRKE